MRLPVITTMKEMKDNKRTNTRIRVGSVMKAKVEEMEKNIRDGRTRKMRREVVGRVQYGVGKNNFSVLFKYGKKKDISDSSLSYICEKEEVDEEVHKTIYDFPEIGQGELLTTNDDPLCEGDGNFGKGIYLYIYFIFCFLLKRHQCTLQRNR